MPRIKTNQERHVGLSMFRPSHDGEIYCITEKIRNKNLVDNDESALISIFRSAPLLAQVISVL